MIFLSFCFTFLALILMMTVALNLSFTLKHLAMWFMHLSMGSLQVNKINKNLNLHDCNFCIFLFTQIWDSICSKKKIWDSIFQPKRKFGIVYSWFLDVPSMFVHGVPSIKLSTKYIQILTHDFPGSGVNNAAKKFDVPATLVAGKNRIDLLSLTVGLQVEPS